MKRTVICSGSQGTCEECREPKLRMLYLKPKGRRLCATCIGRGAARRAELDQELAAMGAHVIHVRDLGAALEARELGAGAVHFATRNARRAVGHEYPAIPAYEAERAAHLARQALGESS